MNAPIQDYIQFGETEPILEEAYQQIPDFTSALRFGKDSWHIRLATILRSIRYKYDDEVGNFLGYGFSFTGMKSWENGSNWQYQLTGGEGISAYTTGIQGGGYDGYPDVNGNLKSLPTYGGWTSYEAYYSQKWHGTFVLY